MTSLPTDKQEYMRIHQKYFDKSFIELYNLKNRLDPDGYVYCEVMLGMYGLKQAAILAYKQLKERLGVNGYRPIFGTTGLWKHDTKNIVFALCVDDFGVNTLKKKTLSIYVQSLRNIMKYQQIGLEETTVASPSNGTTRRAMLTSQCLGTLSKH